ncbi:MAG: ketoacyl reductase, partial [Streptococcus salivarius]|nr:ketoacyl reductase [Streptococcus salivarius]
DALGGSRFQMKPDRVAHQLYRLFEQGTPYAVVGLRYRLLIYLGKLLPQKWIIHFISRYLRKGLNI